MNNKIAIVFDFDITLSPYYQQKEIINHWGEDEERFWDRCTRKVTEEDYDLEHGYIKVMLEYMEENEDYQLLNKDLYNLGKQITLYDGLTKREGQKSIFDDIRAITQSEEFEKLGVEVEYYVISGGLTEMIKDAYFRDFKWRGGRDSKSQKKPLLNPLFRLFTMARASLVTATYP